jgi:hypothetical protein
MFKEGIMEDGLVQAAEVGTLQGSILSPLLNLLDKNQNWLASKQKGRVFWWRMVSSGDIPLLNTHARPLVSSIVQVEQLDRRTSSGCSPDNA